MSTVALNTPHARDLLRKRFAAPEWALMEEVAPRTGGSTGYADAVAVNLWASRGHAVHGVEIKVSRSDWLRELKQPAKAEAVYSYCHHWWIVAPAGVVKEGELPPTWGLLEVRAASLHQIVAAPKLDPKPVTLAFFASLMRRAHENINAHARRMCAEEILAAQVGADKRFKEREQYNLRELENLKGSISKFEEATGLSLARYSGPSIATVKLAQRLQGLSSWGDDQALGKLRALADGLGNAEKSVRAIIADTGLVDAREDAAEVYA